MFVTIFAGGAALKWLLESPNGVRWLFSAISDNTQVTLSAKTITGGLGSALQLEGFALRWPEGELTAAELRIRCQPLLIPFRILSVQELSLRKVKYRDNMPPNPAGPQIVWPRIIGFPAGINGQIEHLTVEDFSYQNLNDPPIAIPDFSTSLDWRDSILTLTSLSVATSSGSLSGSITAGFGEASLASALKFEPPYPLAGCSRFELRTKLLAGRSPEQFAGELTATAFSGGDTRYTLTGAVGLTTKELNLKELALTEKGRGGSIRLTGAIPITGGARIRMRAGSLELERGAGKKVALSGTVELNGAIQKYTGRLDLATSGVGWKNSRITARINGDTAASEFSSLYAEILSGTVSGDLKLDWRNDFTLKAALHGEGLDPARLDPAFNGVLNFDMEGGAIWSKVGVSQGEMRARLLKSRLKGKTLSGEIDADLNGETFRIARLFLTGNGFDIHADGILSQCLNLAANIGDLSALIPQARGSLSLNGWGRYAAGVISGDLSGQGQNLTADGVSIASARVSARIDATPQRLINATAELDGVTHREIRLENAMLKADGTTGSHRLNLSLKSKTATVSGIASGRYADGRWQGELTSLSGDDRVAPWRLAAPVSLTISPQIVTITSMLLTALPSERIELSGQMQLQPLMGSAKFLWSGVDLARANQWLREIRLEGRSSGNLDLKLPGRDMLTLAAKASASGKVTLGKQSIKIQRALLNLDVGDRGTNALLNFQTGEGISISGRLTSPEPATLSIPSQGDIHASWSGLDVALAKRWLPQSIDLQGWLAGEINGRLLTDKRFDLNGTASLAEGVGVWRSKRGELKSAVKKAEVNWNWRGEYLKGDFSMSLADSGEARGNFQLPLPGRFNTAPDQAGRVSGALNGRFHEKGVLTTLFPGVIQDTKGLLEVNLQADGTWRKPSVSGTAALSQAGAYLPTAGVTLSDIKLNADLNETKVRIKSFRVTSGTGSLEGSAELDLDGNKLTGYKGVLRGERFQVVHLPELQIQLSPDLTFEGNLDKLSARGLLLVPEMLMNNQKSATLIKPSRDVRVTGRAVRSSQKTVRKLDMQLRLLLGDQVVVKSEGFDARLEGEINLRMSAPAAAVANGEIRVAKGSYNIYGVKLDINRGRALFSGGSVERPTLDILALREVDSVKAGVTVTGTPEAPVIKLYSEPALADTDILSYVVLGRKLGESGGQAAVLMRAASLLVSPGDGPGLQDKLKKLVHLDTINYSADKDRSSGYKYMESGLRDNSQNSRASSGVSESMLLLGKYLTPDLYVSYGRSLFTESQQFRARYSISRQWEVESKVSAGGTGGDLYFRIELE